MMDTLPARSADSRLEEKARGLAGRRILFVFRTFGLGGTERQAFRLALFLREEHRSDVRILGLCREQGRFSRLCDENGIPWQSIPVDWPPGKAGRALEIAGFARRLRQERPDILFSYNWFPNVLCGLTWKLSGAALFVWNQRNEGHDLDRSRTHRAAVRLTPRYISNSVHGRNFLLDTYGIDPGKVAVIPNGVPIPRADDRRNIWRGRLGLDADTFVVCMVANLTAYKDHPTVLAAWRNVLDRNAGGGPPAVLLLAGRPDYREPALKKIAFDLDLCGQVRFLGEIEDVAGLLSASDLCVHGSNMEGCPNAVLEAMAASLPVVATDIPGIREAVGPEGIRFLVPPGDPQGLADRILGLMKNPGMRSSTGASMRRRVETEFDPLRMCERTAEFIAFALGRPGGPGGG